MTPWPPADLATPTLPLADLLAALAAAEPPPAGLPTLAIGLSANVTAEPALPHFKRQAYLAGMACQFVPGTLDAHRDNMRAFAAQGLRVAVLLLALDHLVPACETRLPTMPPADVDALAERIASEVGLALDAASALDAVYVTRFHRSTPPPALGPDAVGAAIAAFDAALEAAVAGRPNARLLDTPDVIAAIGRDRALNTRFGLTFRAPYTGAFWDELARRVVAATRASGPTAPKVLVLDADDTLWGGVVGEDGVDALALGPHTYPGNVYWTVQHALLALRRQGALLALCTRNEPADLDAALAHPEMVLRRDDFVAVSADWRDKPTRLRELAETLGLGLDAFVFLDDSSFECEAVRQALPMVRAFQVPKHVFAYPALVAEIAALFRPAADGGDRTARYAALAEAAAAHATAPDEATFLRSLELRVTVRRDDAAQAPRVAELTARANQFNLTTRRWAEAEVAAAMADPDQAVYALGVRDKFGDAGLTGVAVVRYDGDVAVVADYLLSCRVLGRGVEWACWGRILDDARARGCSTIAAEYRPTARNAQVADFWARLGLAEVATSADGTRYAAPLAGLVPPAAPHIEVTADG